MVQRDIKIIDTMIDEETVKNDLSCVKIPGAIYWRGVFIKDFSKDQLIKIIYLLMENK